VLGLTACGGQEAVEDAKMYGEGVDSAFETEDMQLETCIMAVGEEEVSLNEMLFYVYQLKVSYDGSMTNQIWNYKYNDKDTIGDYSKGVVTHSLFSFDPLHFNKDQRLETSAFYYQSHLKAKHNQKSL